MVGKLRATGVGLLAASGIAAVWNEFAGVHSRKNMVKAAEINLDDIHGLRRHRYAAHFQGLGSCDVR